MKFGENVKKLRMERELTQGDLAQALSVTPQTVSRWESGQALPDLLLLSDIADYFGVSTDELLGRSFAHDLRRRAFEARDRANREKTPESRRNYLASLLQLVERGEDVGSSLGQYMSQAIIMHRDGILKDKELLGAERTTKNYIKDLPANGRMTCLSLIVTNEDEERLENWHEFLPDLERWHGATWEDQLTRRYCLRGEKERFEKQQQKNCFGYLWHFVSSSAHETFLPEKSRYPSSDLCMQILSVIDVFSAKEDDLFLPLRIYAEGLAANAFFDEKKPEKAKEIAQKAIAHVDLLWACRGKERKGSTPAFDLLSEDTGDECVSNAANQLGGMLHWHDPNLTEEEKNERDAYAERVRTRSDDPFDRFGEEDRRIYAELLNRAKEAANGNADEYAVTAVLQGAKGVEVFEIGSLFDDDAYGKIGESLRQSGNTEILRAILLHNRACYPVFPCAAFRKMLSGIDKRNHKTKILFFGALSYEERTLGQLS